MGDVLEASESSPKDHGSWEAVSFSSEETSQLCYGADDLSDRGRRIWWFWLLALKAAESLPLIFAEYFFRAGCWRVAPESH